MFSGSVEPFALNRARKGRGDVEIQRVAKLVGLGRSAGLDAGRQIARVVASEARLAERAQQIAQRLEAEEVEALVGDLELGLLLRFAGLPADARLLRGIVRLVDRDVVFLLHALDQLLDQFIELPSSCHLLELLAHLLVEQVAVHQRLLDGSRSSSSVCSPSGSLVPHGFLETALQQVVRERAEQVFHAHLAGRIGNVFGVANAFHKDRFQLPAFGFRLSVLNLIVISSVVPVLTRSESRTAEAGSLVKLPSLPERPLVGLERFLAHASGFFSPAVKTRSSLRPMRLWACKPSRMNSAADTCCSGVSFGANAQRAELVDQALNPFQLVQRLLGRNRIGQLNFAAQVEPLHDLLHVRCR